MRGDLTAFRTITARDWRDSIQRARGYTNSVSEQIKHMTQLTTVQPEGSAVALIREAISSGKSPEYLRELLSVRQVWEADEARKAFNLAIAEFQRRAPIIAKEDKAYDKQYARMDRIWREIRPLLTELGLSVTWQVCELREQTCHVEGQLRHRQGHGERLVQDIPMPELIKGQNKAQQMGSAATYARRYALCAALGIVTGDDDDGHAAGGNLVTADQAQELRELVDAARGVDGFNEKAFYGYAGTDDLGALPQARFEDVRKALKRKIGGGK